MQRASFATVVSVLLAGVSGLANAQEPSRLDGRLMPRITVAGAFDARNNGSGDPELYLGLATLEWNTRVRGLAVRVDGMYAQRDRINHARCAERCESLPGVAVYSFLSSKVTAAGAMAGITYALRSRGAVRPYVLAAAGLMRSHDKFVSGTQIVCPACATVNVTAPALESRNEQPLSAAAQAGVGVAYSLRWFSVLAESRYVAVDYQNTRALNGAVPVSLGIRF
jgi:hypothetical protein